MAATGRLERYTAHWSSFPTLAFFGGDQCSEQVQDQVLGASWHRSKQGKQLPLILGIDKFGMCRGARLGRQRAVGPFLLEAAELGLDIDTVEDLATARERGWLDG